MSIAGYTFWAYAGIVGQLVYEFIHAKVKHPRHNWMGAWRAQQDEWLRAWRLHRMERFERRLARQLRAEHRRRKRLGGKPA